MHILTLNIQDNAYDKILYFLKNLSHDVEIINDKTIAQEEESISSLGGILHKYADASKIELEDSAWENHVEEKYR